ncbi:putative DNA-binding transcriptional regulator AlpA [Bradyrhizobium sp. USDA 4341]
MSIANARSATIPPDFPNPHRLGGRDLYLAVLGNPAPSTFARWLAEGKIPKPQKLGSLNRWPETVMADTRDSGIA